MSTKAEQKDNTGQRSEITRPKAERSPYIFRTQRHFIFGIGAASFFTDIAYTVIGKIVFGISYVITFIFAVVISLEAWLVGVVLNINNGVFQSAIVQQGFAITLSIANLGFVAGIIVIALATILHREPYGIKKLLWKLVVAAILVNFSLVIIAPIFGFSNSITQYFLNCINPGTGCSGSVSGTGIASMNYFATSLVGAFNPQKSFNPEAGIIGNLNQISTSTTLSLANNNYATANFGSSLSQMIVPIVSVVSMAGSLFAFVLTLGTLVLMLLMRYLWIAILAILMPFAWLGWVFPNIKDWWSKWWKNFFKWTFFAPAVVFFLYLAIATATAMANAGSTTGSQSFATYTSTTDGLWGAISTFFGSVFSPIIQSLLDQFVFIGLCFAGLYVANSMSITFADGAMKIAKTAGQAVQGYATKKGTRALTYPLRTKTGRKVTESLQTLGVNQNRFVRALTTPVREVGTATAKLRAPGEKQLGEEHKQYDKLSLEEQGRRMGTANNPGQLAILENLTKAQKSKEPKLIAAANRVFASLPEDMKNRIGRLQLLYGKGTSLPVPPGARTETFAGGGSKAQKALEKEREKIAKEGGDTSEYDEALNELKETEEESTEAQRESTRATKKATATAKKPPTININVGGGARFEAGPSGIRDTGSNPTGNPTFRRPVRTEDTRFEAGPEGIRDINPDDNNDTFTGPKG